MTAIHSKSFPKVGLAACVLGLVLCPYVYIAIGALGGFAPAFTLVTLPPLAASTGYLLYRFLSKPRAPAKSRASLWVEILSWTVISAFLVLVSGFTLQTTFERIGLSSSFFLAASAACLPAVLARRSALQERINRVPERVAAVVLVAVLAITGTVAATFLLAAPAFI